MPESTRPPVAVALIARFESIDTFARPSSNRQYTFPGAPRLASGGLGRLSEDAVEQPPPLPHHDGRGDGQVDDRGGHDATVAPVEHRVDLVLEALLDLAARGQRQTG